MHIEKPGRSLHEVHTDDLRDVALEVLLLICDELAGDAAYTGWPEPIRKRALESIRAALKAGWRSVAVDAPRKRKAACRTPREAAIATRFLSLAALLETTPDIEALGLKDPISSALQKNQAARRDMKATCLPDGSSLHQLADLADRVVSDEGIVGYRLDRAPSIPKLLDDKFDELYAWCSNTPDEQRCPGLVCGMDGKPLRTMTNLAMLCSAKWPKERRAFALAALIMKPLFGLGIELLKDVHWLMDHEPQKLEGALAAQAHASGVAVLSQAGDDESIPLLAFLDELRERVASRSNSIMLRADE